MQEKERSEKVLENLDSLEKRQKIRKFLVISIISVLIIIIVFLGVSFYTYFQSPEKTLGLGAEIESFLTSEDGKTAYIKLSGGSLNKNITKIKFLFYDSDGKEFVYETSEGIKEIEVPYSRSFWDWLFGRQLVGSYDYSINSSEVGLENFNDIENVSSKFEYQTETGDVIETPVLDTERTTNRTATPGRGDEEDGETTPTPTSCTNDTGCTVVGNFCSGNIPYNCIAGSDGCLDRDTKPSCTTGQTCENGNCVNIVECSNDLNCSSDYWHNVSRIINDTQCTEKNQTRSEYKDYYCNLTLNICQYKISNETNWTDIETLNRPNGITCDDDLFCSVNDSCLGGVCLGQNKTCEDDSIACTVPYCDENNNQCSFNISSCSCINNSDCPNDGNVCTNEVCIDFSCETNYNTNNCNDNNACTKNDLCSLGVCSGSLINCDDSISCTENNCNPLTGCAFTPDNSFCDDNLYCNGQETCNALLGCEAGIAPDCNDAISCTQDSCNETANLCNNIANNNLCDDSNICTDNICDLMGCEYPFNTAPCNDLVLCTENDICSLGSCIGTSNNNLCESWETCILEVGCEQTSCSGCSNCDTWLPFDCNYNECHTQCQIGELCYYNGILGDSCIALNDACLGISSCSEYSREECVNNPCSVAGAPNGCELDGSNCVDADYCGDGTCDANEDCSTCLDCVCGGGTPYCSSGECVECIIDGNCGDSIACTTDSCVLGICSNTPNNNLCNDNNICNGIETCDSILGCQSGTALSCDNSLWCDGTEICDSILGCQSGTSPVCNDGTSCSIDFCNETIDSCDADFSGCSCPNGLDSECNDNNICNGIETCNTETLTCQSGTALSCNDNNICNGVETCDSVLGCLAGTALNCDDNLYCNGQETCNALLGCQLGIAPDCNDAISCTQDSCNENTDDCDNIADDLLCESWETCSTSGCTERTCSSCSDCELFWGINCNYNKCKNDCDDCYYDPVLGQEDCVTLNELCNSRITTCSDYYELECNNDVCNLNCNWSGSDCVEISGCINCSNMDFRTVALWAYPDSNTVTGIVNIGLVAYDANRIERVDFNVSGTIYSVYEETINPDTNEYEYVLNLDTTTLSDGKYNITATIYDYGSENYTFWPVIIQVDNNPSYNNFYVDSINGNDLNDGSYSNPFKTLNKGLLSASSGDTIYLRDGNYSMNFSGVSDFDKYTTIMPDSGANPKIIRRDTPQLTVNYLKFVNLTFDWSHYENTKDMIIIRTYVAHHLWFNGNKFIGPSRSDNDLSVFKFWTSTPKHITIEKNKIEMINLAIALSGGLPFNGIVRQNEIGPIYGDAFDVNADALVTGNIIYSIGAPRYYIESKNQEPYDFSTNNIFNIYYDEYSENDNPCTHNDNCTYSALCQPDGTCLGYYEMNFDLSSLGSASAQDVADFLNNDIEFNDRIYASSENGYLRLTTLRTNYAQWLYVNGNANTVFSFSQINETSTYGGTGQHGDIFQNWLSNEEEALGGVRENTIIRNNRAYNIRAQGFLTQANNNGLIFINNMIDIQSDSFALGFNSNYHYANTIIEHNTIWGGGSSQDFPAIMNGDNFIMRNNIFGPRTGAGDNTNNAEVIMDYNIYDYSYSTPFAIGDNSVNSNPNRNIPTTTPLFKNVIASYVTHLFCDTCPINGIPLGFGHAGDPGYKYSGDFHLSWSSVAKNFGSNNSTIKYDIDWDLRDSIPDAGADEYIASCTVPANPSAECNDFNPCTNDICTAGLVCDYNYNANTCEDGIFCNGVETCQVGSCISPGNPCTTQQLCFEPNICLDVDYSADYLAYYRFENNLNDETGNFNGIMFGDPQYILGMQGKALEFDFIEDYIETNLDGTEYDELTILAWVNTKSLTNNYNYYNYIVDNSPGSAGFGLRRDDANLQFFVLSNGNTGIVTLSNIFEKDNWMHVAAVHNISGNYLYINGTLISQALYDASSGIDNSSYSMKIGVEYNIDGRSFWNGSIDEVMIYNRALNSSEVLDIYNSQSVASQNCTDLIQNQDETDVDCGGTICSVCANGMDCLINSDCLSGNCSSNICSQYSFSFPTDYIAYWKLDTQTAGITPDETGINNGSLMDNAVIINAEKGNVLSLDGNLDFVNITDSSTLEPSNVTISMWVYPNIWAGSHRALIAKRPTSSTGYLIFYYTSTNTINVDWGGSGQRWNTGYLPDLNTWTHIVYTYNGTKGIFYVNGISFSVTSLGSSTNIPTTANLHIGSDSSATKYYFNGLLDDVMIYNRTLNASEIWKIYETQNRTLIPSGNISGNIYYVDANLTLDCFGTYSIVNRDCSGSDGRAFNTIQKAINVVKAGKTILVRDGIYRESVNINVNGTAADRIIIKAYPGEKPILEGTQVISSWTQCTSQAECLNNSNWQNIYYAQTSINLTEKLLLEDKEILQISQEPDQSDSVLEQTAEFVSLENEGNNFGHQIISINPGLADAGSFSIADSDGFYSTLFKAGETIIVGIKSSSNQNNRTYTLTRDATYNGGITTLTVNREVFDAPYDNIEVENQRFFVDSDRLVQDDDYWNNTKIRFWSHGANNWVVTKYVKDFIQARNMIVFDVPLADEVSPGGTYPDAYSFQNYPLILDKAGEYYHTTQPDINGNYTVYLWPRNILDLNNKIDISVLTRGFYINSGYGSYVTIDGFTMRGYSAPEENGRSGGIICPDNFNHEGLEIKNNFVYNNKVYAGIAISSGNYDIIKNNVIYNILDGRGILLAGTNGKAIGNNITKTASTLLYPGLKKGLLMNNIIGIGGTHSNGMAIYAGNENILVTGNKIEGNRLAFELCQNLTIYNNILDSKGRGDAISEWGDGENIYIFNNIITGSDNNNSLSVGSNTTTSKNNIIGGGSTINRSHNIYIARVWSQGPGYGWLLQEGEIVADGTTVYGNAYTVNDIFQDISTSYELKENSIAIDNGTNIINELPDYLNDPFFAEVDFYKDIEGNTRPQGDGWDIGAYEYQQAMAGSLSPFTKILDFIKGLLTTKTGNAVLTGKITGNVVSETGKLNYKIQYIILSFFIVIILIILFMIVRIKKNKKRSKKKIGKKIRKR